MFELISTCRYDPALRNVDWNSAVNAGSPSPYFLLPFSFDRLQCAAQLHKWFVPADLTLNQLQYRCDQVVQTTDDQPQKIRILLSATGDVTIAVSPVPHAARSLIYAATINPLTDDLSPLEPLISVYLDTEQTPSSIFTSTKTTNRPHYDAARDRFNLPAVGSEIPPGHKPADVLLRNTDNLVTETSIRNIAFFRTNCWVTPTLGTGCLPGITRRLLLDQALVIEGDMYADDVNPEEIVLLFNAVEGCKLGRITTIQ